jgi:hypothetical protein
MSASELIEQLKALPAEDREVFMRLLRELETPSAPAASEGAGAPAAGDWPDFGARLRRIYGNKVVAGSEAVISYGRGDW